MKSAAIIVGKNSKLKNIDLSNTYVIGVERGCLQAIKSRIHIDVAVGDFDSINKRELKKIYSKVEKVIKLNPVKDDTDTFHAYKLVKNYDKITIIGSIQGRRIEHFLAILNILKKDKKVEVIDDYSRVFSIDSSDSPYKITSYEYKYTSIFALENSLVTLNNFKYPLNRYRMSTDDSLGISNEVLPSKIGEINLDLGRLLIVQSKKDTG